MFWHEFQETSLLPRHTTFSLSRINEKFKKIELKGFLSLFRLLNGFHSVIPLHFVIGLQLLYLFFKTLKQLLSSLFYRLAHIKISITFFFIGVGTAQAIIDELNNDNVPFVSSLRHFMPSWRHKRSKVSTESRSVNPHWDYVTYQRGPCHLVR